MYVKLDGFAVSLSISFANSAGRVVDDTDARTIDCWINKMLERFSVLSRRAWTDLALSRSLGVFLTRTIKTTFLDVSLTRGLEPNAQTTFDILL